MRLPQMQGVIHRRLLVNFRARPEVVAGFLPAPFAPKAHNGWSILGICLIRLEKIRPSGLPTWLGTSSENAAHRIAVTWNHGRSEGVFIPRRDTDSTINQLAGGRLFPGEHHRADFKVEDDGDEVSIQIHAARPPMDVRVRGRAAGRLPENSVFSSLTDSSGFFASGSIGYSATRDPGRFDGLRLHTDSWDVSPFDIEEATSTFFEDVENFPAGSIEFDHALVMRRISHHWIREPDKFSK